MSERQCVYCGDPEVDLWASWNLVGDWVCRGCSPDEPDWLTDDPTPALPARATQHSEETTK